MKYYKCGHIMTPHGLKGEFKVKNLSDFDRFKKNSDIYVLYNDEYVLEKIAKATTVDGNIYLMSFVGKEDINLIEKYRNTDLYISELQRNKNDLDDGEYYYSDLIGKELVNQNGVKRGKVLDIREYPQANYMALKYEGKSVLVPVRIITSVTDDTVIIDEIEGLF